MKSIFYGFVVIIMIVTSLYFELLDDIYDGTWKVLPEYQGYQVVGKYDTILYTTMIIQTNNSQIIRYCNQLYLKEYALGDTVVASTWK